MSKTCPRVLAAVRLCGCRCSALMHMMRRLLVRLVAPVAAAAAAAAGRWQCLAVCLFSQQAEGVVEVRGRGRRRHVFTAIDVVPSPTPPHAIRLSTQNVNKAEGPACPTRLKPTTRPCKQCVRRRRKKTNCTTATALCA